MRLADRLRTGKRSLGIGTLEQLAQSMSYDGHRYPLSTSMSGSPYNEPAGNFEAYVAEAHRRNGVVAAAVTARALLLSQLQFQWRRRWSQDRELFGSGELALLDSFTMPRPQWLMALEQHVSYAGNAYIWHDEARGRLRLLKPDRVGVVLGSHEDVDPQSLLAEMTAEVVGYCYKPETPGADVVMLAADKVAHWAPDPNPCAPWRGESWVTAVAREIALDGQATDHLGKFYANAATPNLAVSFDASLDADTVREYAQLLQEQHAGTTNAYRTMAIGGGADVSVVGSDMRQMGYRDTQGGHENRIAVRSRVPGVILGTRESQQGSSLNSGNYASTRRLFADSWFSPTADGLCAALDPLLTKPAGSPVELTYDPARVMFLQEDRKDEADIAQANAQAMKALVDAGYTADSVRDAVTAGDFSKLDHSGLFSVQLQEPGAGDAPAPPDAGADDAPAPSDA